MKRVARHNHRGHSRLTAKATSTDLTLKNVSVLPLMSTDHQKAMTWYYPFSFQLSTEVSRYWPKLKAS